MRDCQPAPVDLKYRTTSGLYRTDSSTFVFADFGRPSSVRSGTIAFNCDGVSGCASGSAFAAAVIARSSATVGMIRIRRFPVFDIVSLFAAVGPAQADDAPRVGPVDECHEVHAPG